MERYFYTIENIDYTHTINKFEKIEALLNNKGFYKYWDYNFFKRLEGFFIIFADEKYIHGRYTNEPLIDIKDFLHRGYKKLELPSSFNLE